MGEYGKTSIGFMVFPPVVRVTGGGTVAKLSASPECCKAAFTSRTLQPSGMRSFGILHSARGKSQLARTWKVSKGHLACGRLQS